jgi:hypothetical protein
MASTEKENNDWAELARKHANTNPVERLDEEELNKEVESNTDETKAAAKNAIAGITNGLSPLDL